MACPARTLTESRRILIINIRPCARQSKPAGICGKKVLYKFYSSRISSPGVGWRRKHDIFRHAMAPSMHFFVPEYPLQEWPHLRKSGTGPPLSARQDWNASASTCQWSLAGPDFQPPVSIATPQRWQCRTGAKTVYDASTHIPSPAPGWAGAIFPSPPLPPNLESA